MDHNDLNAIQNGSLIALLDSCNNDELKTIVDYIMKTNTEFLSIQDEYKKYSPDHSKYTHLIAKEIRDFGGNSFVNIFRGSGPSYAEVVRDVAKQVGVKNLSDDVVNNEKLIIEKIFEDAWEKLSEEERDQFFKDAGVDSKTRDMFKSGMKIGTILTLISGRMAGFLFYRMTVVIANAVAKQLLGRGLALGTNAALTRTVGIFLGPVGWIITGLWTVIDLAGPAYRVTMPCVVHLAYLRQKRLYEAVAAAAPDTEEA